MPLAIAIVIIFVLLGILWVAIAREPGPGPADVAIAYENAWDRLDFELLFDLSGDELRDQMRRDEFVAAKRAAYANVPNRRLHAHVAVEEIVQADGTAIVVTNVVTDDGRVRNNVMLEKRPAGWLVVGYSLKAVDGASGA